MNSTSVEQRKATQPKVVTRGVFERVPLGLDQRVRRLEGLHTLFSFWPNNVKFLIFSTTDWSQLDSAEAPTQQKIIAKYADLFQCEVSPTRYKIDGNPQLELRFPIEHLNGAAEAIETLFRGDDNAAHSGVWFVLWHQLAAIIRAHNTHNPVMNFSPPAAAVMALQSIRFQQNWPKLEGYRSIKLRELRNGTVKPIVTTGPVPRNIVHEGGHFFRFEFDESRDTKEKRIAEALLVDAYGVNQSFLYEGMSVNVTSFTQKILYAPNRLQKLPTYFLPRPPVTPRPPESHRMTFKASLTEEQRIQFETHLGRRTETAEDGNVLIHLDFLDVPNWVELRSRLLAGENIAQDRQACNAVVKRLMKLFSLDFGRIFPSHDAMIFFALGLIQDQSGNHPKFAAKTPNKPVSEKGGTLPHLARMPLTLVASGIHEMRLCGVADIHPFIMEKRGQSSIIWIDDNVPYAMPTDTTHDDYGFALSYIVNGAMRRVWIDV